MVVKGMSQVPIVDISPFTSGGTLSSRQKAAKQLAEKIHLNGSAGISGHGVSPDILHKAFALAKRLFDLPYEDKMKAPHPEGMVPHRGYSGMGREQGAAKTALETDDDAAKDEYLNTSDYKESYEVGSEENKIQYNIWLPDDVLPGFRPSTLKLFWELNKTAGAILEALIMGLSLSEEEADTIRALHDGHDNQLRLLHYPSVPAAMLKDTSVGRLGAHTDWSTFTMLFQNESAGLEFGDRKTGEFMSAIPTEGVLYINIGDMLQRISNGFYPSALHRVVITGKASGGDTPERYSIPYFVVPKPDGVIEPQASLVNLHGEKVYERVTFNSYSEQMFQATQNRD